MTFPTRPQRRRAAAMAAAVTAGLVLAGCGTTSDSDDAGADGDGGPETVEVTMVDFAFQGLPAAVSAGTRLTVTKCRRRRAARGGGLPAARW